MLNKRKSFILRVVAFIITVAMISSNIFTASGITVSYSTMTFRDSNNYLSETITLESDGGVLTEESATAEQQQAVENTSPKDEQQSDKDTLSEDEYQSDKDMLLEDEHQSDKDIQQAENDISTEAKQQDEVTSSISEEEPENAFDGEGIQLTNSLGFNTKLNSFQQRIVTSIKTGNDDAEVSASAVNLVSTGLDLHGLVSNVPHSTYLRFTGISMPEDAVITNAYLEFTARDASANPTSLSISGEIGSGEAFASTVSSFNSRTFSQASVQMDTPIISVGIDYQTNDLTDVINEMFQSNGGSENYVFRIDGSAVGSFIMRSYNSSTSKAPRLVIEYASAYGEYSSVVGQVNDDAEEYGVGKVIDFGSTLDIGGYYSASLVPAYKQITGLRFTNVELPEYAAIEDAYIEFTAYTTVNNQISNMEIRGELGDPSPYLAVAGNISNRTYGDLSVRYTQPSFTVRYEKIRTPNLKDLINENKLMGWSSGQTLAFMIDGDNYIGNVYQAGSAYPPKLVIRYRYDENGGGIDGLVKAPEDIHNIWINEVALKGTSQLAEPWIEIYNANDYPVLLDKDIYLSNSISNYNRYEFNQFLIPAKGYRVIAIPFSSDGSTPQFILSSYYNQTVHTIDSFQTLATEVNETSGRFEDATPHIVKYKSGTYASSNQQLSPEITVSVNKPSGIYEAGFSLEILTDSVNTIRYTTDGSNPGYEYGELYTMPIPIDSSTTIKIFVYNSRSSSKVLTYVYQIGKGELEFRENRKSIRIKTGTDDAEVSATSVNLTSTGLDLHGLISGVANATYLRFTEVSLPKDAVITNAYLEFSARNVSTTPTELTVYGELGNGDGFTTVASTFHNRNLTDASVSSVTPRNVAINEVIQTDDLSGILNEMRSNNYDLEHYVFKVEGNKTGSFIARSFESEAARAPELVIEYLSGYGEYTGVITAINDDAEEYGTAKAIDLNSIMEIGGYFSATLTPPYKLISGFRFANVSLPEDAEIEDAYLEFTTYGTNTQNVVSNMKIQIELGNPVSYQAVSGDISKRNYGDLAVDFKLSGFTAARQIVRTPNLKDIINENRLRGWKNGQALAFLVDGDNFIGSVYQGGSIYPPKLVIRYKYSGLGAVIDGAVTDSAEIKNVFINEVSAEGTTSSKESWIEFYNDNDVPVIMGDGCYLSNSSKLTKYQFKNFMIPAKGYRILYMDEDPSLGNDYSDLSIKSSGELFLSTASGSKITSIDSLKYTKHSYNQTYGRREDGSSTLVLFSSETFCSTNNDGKENYNVVLSKERGVYDTSFTLAIESKEGTTIRYSLDGSAPTEISGNIYNKPLTIMQSCVIKIFAYDEKGNSGVLAHTYILKDNYQNEIRSGVLWYYKDSITSELYADAISQLPIVSVSGNASALVKDIYAQSTFEYLDSHLEDGGSNFFSDTGAKKFGQVSAAQYNAGVAVRFKRDYNAKKVKYPFFESFEGDAYPVVAKFGKLELKEGQDGPQSDIYGLGYNRYDEKVTNTLAKQMQKLALNSRYVHYFYNGKYMGVKTLREDFGQNLFEDYFGDDSDNYTKIRYQDAYFTSGIVEEGDGDTAIFNKIMSVARNKDFQEFKKYVDVEDMIKTQILYMFIDTEREIDAVVHNDVYNGGGKKLTFNVNDTDGAFFNRNQTGTIASALDGGGGTYRFKWISDGISRRGAGDMFGYFSGDSSTNPAAGNLEFKTLVKDQVLLQIGPASGDYRGSQGAPLSVDNVQKVIAENVAELNEVYQLDAAFMSARANMYQDWVKCQIKVQNQVPDRVKFSLEMWAKYNMAHTLAAVSIVNSGSGVVLSNPNLATVKVYYTMDGTDPMGADGIISSSAIQYTDEVVLNSGGKLTIRPYTDNNWGPLTVR